MTAGERAARGAAEQVDAMMEHASRALADTRYFEAVSLCVRALGRCHAARDHERMARICLPLQESRRQIRQTAVDAGTVRFVASPEDLPRPLAAGCYFLQPPLIGADGRALRTAAERAKVAVYVLTREPLTQAGLWPIVGTARVSVRVRVAPPVPVERQEQRVSKDGYIGEPPIPLAWFEAAGEALGDAAIAEVPSREADRHPWWRVEDLLERLEAVPEHEKLHQALAEACRDAANAPVPTETRRPMLNDPWAF